MYLKIIFLITDFTVSINFTIYLSNPAFGFSDTEAGVLYGVWGFLISALGLLTGPFVIDKIGIFKKLKFSNFSKKKKKQFSYIKVFENQ